jgi:hypothetical protein
MKRIYTPTRGVEDWQSLLAEPEKQWKTGFSARSIAYAWEEAGGFPHEVYKALDDGFPGIVPLSIIPEHQVPLPGGKAASQNDVWVLAKSAEDLISIAVEGKVSEPFGPTIGEWNPDASTGRRKRFHFLKDLLGLDEISRQVSAINCFTGRHRQCGRRNDLTQNTRFSWFTLSALKTCGLMTLPILSGCSAKSHRLIKWCKPKTLDSHHCTLHGFKEMKPT